MSQLIYEYYTPEGIAKSKNISNSTRLVLDEADRQGVQWEIVPCTQLIELTHQGKTRTFYHQVPSSTKASAMYTCHNKTTTTNLLLNNNLSVPKGFRVTKKSSPEYLLSVFEGLQKPLVVKPSNGSWGENISVNINSHDEYQAALKLAFEYSSKKADTAIVEEMFIGPEYRILATREKVIGVLYRRPASVVGNGVDSIETLIHQKNKNPIRGVKNGVSSHFKIGADERMLRLLHQSDRNLDSIIPKGERAFLREVSNISQGGDAIDMTDVVHESVKVIALAAIQSVPGLSFAGIDFLSSDITKQQTKDTYTIIEINDSPGFDIHDFPYQGKNRHAAQEFLYLMFPELLDTVGPWMVS